MGTEKSKNANVTPFPGTPVPEMDAYHFGQTIRQFRELAHLEQAEVARACGVAPTTISNWEHDRSRPSLSLVPVLCRILNMPLEVFFNLPVKAAPAVVDESKQLSSDEQSLINGYRKLSSINQWQLRKMLEVIISTQLRSRRQELRETFCRLRGHDISLAAGFGMPLDGDTDTFPIFVRISKNAERADDVFPVNGHSMEPEYPDGSMVFVKGVDVNDLSYGDTIACIADGTPFVKIYEKDGLHSLNPEFDVIHVSEDDSFQLIGRVIGRVPEADLASKAETAELLEAFSD